MFHKLFFILFSIFSVYGFKLLTPSKWKISQGDPTIWVRLCSDMKTRTISKNDVPSGDVLAGATVTGAQALVSIVNDFNAVNSAYIRFAAYPDDPSNPGAPQAGDSTFTLALAENRTIDVCYNDPTNPFQGGGARLEESGDDIIGCDITISDSAKKSLKQFVRTLTHEIGHCAGLDHPQETKHAIMSYFADSKKLRLMMDDKMGLVFLYPVAGVDMKEKANFGLSCSRN